MALPRFFVDPADIADGMARLAGPEREHAVRVLRLGPGEEAVLFDGKGFEYPARIVEVGRQAVRLSVGGRRACAGDPRRARVTLLQGVPRLARMDWLVEKVTEAGAAALVPVLAKRSPPEARRARGRLERWRTISREACRQCGRSALPDVLEPVEPASAWEVWGRAEGRRAILDPRASSGLRAWIDSSPSAAWVLAVGPEGGWDPEELEAARRAGFEPVAAGPRTLRAETAALVAVTAVQLAAGDLGLPPTPEVDRPGTSR